MHHGPVGRHTPSSPRRRPLEFRIVGGPRAATNVSATRVSRALSRPVRKDFRMGSKGGTSRRSLVIVGATVGTSFKLAAQDRGSETVEIVDSETASIDGRIWDKPIAGGKTVDAVHRSVLLRFPAMAEPVAA